jgi:hypothetical protein
MPLLCYVVKHFLSYSYICSSLTAHYQQDRSIRHCLILSLPIFNSENLGIRNILLQNLPWFLPVSFHSSSKPHISLPYIGLVSYNISYTLCIYPFERPVERGDSPLSILSPAAFSSAIGLRGG